MKNEQNLFRWGKIDVLELAMIAYTQGSCLSVCVSHVDRLDSIFYLDLRLSFPFSLSLSLSLSFSLSRSSPFPVSPCTPNT